MTKRQFTGRNSVARYQFLSRKVTDPLPRLSSGHCRKLESDLRRDRDIGQTVPNEVRARCRGLTTSVFGCRPGRPENFAAHRQNASSTADVAQRDQHFRPLPSTCAGWPCCDGRARRAGIQIRENLETLARSVRCIQCYLSMEF